MKLLLCVYLLASLNKAMPDHTTIMNFRHLLERNGLTRKLFNEVNQWLTEAGVLLKEGTPVDAMIIEVPTSTKQEISCTETK